MIPASAVPDSVARRVVTVPDAGAMRALGSRLAEAASPGDVICLFGDLGAGKTELAKGFGEGLGIDVPVSSPSFVLMAEYAGRLPFFHLDLYRLGGAADVLDGGLIDEREAAGVTLIEWSERLGDDLPVSRLEVRIDGLGDAPRTVLIEAADARHRGYLRVLA